MYWVQFPTGVARAPAAVARDGHESHHDVVEHQDRRSNRHQPPGLNLDVQKTSSEVADCDPLQHAQVAELGKLEIRKGAHRQPQQEQDHGALDDMAP